LRYDRQWWGVAPGLDPKQQTYWSISRSAWASLLFMLPFLLVYEGTIAAASGEATRATADVWVRGALAWVGLRDPWWPPFLLLIGLLSWHVKQRRDWKVPLSLLPAMAIEGLLLALVLVGLGKLIDLGFAHIDGLPTIAVANAAPSWVDYVGAGLYEEVVFRLLLVSLIAASLGSIGTPKVLAAVVTMSSSALAFALAHHLGGPGEAFTWFAFVFRWTAGVFFAWVFLERGFGVAVGTHTAYDVLVGGLGWQL
jgi:hypothetical protein